MFGLSRRDRQAAADKARLEAQAEARKVYQAQAVVERQVAEVQRARASLDHALVHSDDQKAIIALWKVWRTALTKLAEVKAEHVRVASL